MAYGKGPKAETTHRRSVEIGRIAVDSMPDAARLRGLIVDLAEHMASSVWPAAPLTTALNKKKVDAGLLAVQTGGGSTLNSVWREKTRLFVKDALVEQSKRLRRCAYGKILNAAATRTVVDGEKTPATVSINVPRDIGVEPTALKAALEGLEAAGRTASFDDVMRLVADAGGPGASAAQRTVLDSMRSYLVERWGRPSWDKPRSTVPLNLDERCVHGRRQVFKAVLEGLNEALLKGEDYRGVLPLAGVETRGPKLVLPLAFDRDRIETLAFGPRPPKPPRLVKGGRTVPANDNSAGRQPYRGPLRFSALAVEIGADDVVIKAVLSMPKAMAKPTQFRRLIGRDFGYANTIALSVVEFEDTVDVAVASNFEDMSREDVLARLTSHVAPHGMKVVETIRMSGRNFLDRVAARSQRIDVLRSEIDRLYLRVKRLKDRICAEIGVAVTDRLPEVLGPEAKPYVRVWHRKMFGFLAAVKRLKAERLRIYRAIDGLKKSWFGYLANMETRLALTNGAAHVREDLTVMAAEKTHPDYKGRTFNRMIDNGAKGQYIRRAEAKFEWFGVTAVAVPSRFTSTTDHRFGVVDAAQRKGEAFVASIDGLREHADEHASATIACWLAMVPITGEQRRVRDGTLAVNAASAKTTTCDKRSTGPGRQAA